MEIDNFYLTLKGLKNLKQEYAKLKELRRLKQAESAPSVLYSEELNTEFVAFKEELDRIDLRLSEIEHILKHSKIIKSPCKSSADKVGFGACVTVINGNFTQKFVIVGTLEANPNIGQISNESPVGRALLGRRVGDVVIVNFPKKTIYKIKNIRY